MIRQIEHQQREEIRSNPMTLKKIREEIEQLKRGGADRKKDKKDKKDKKHKKDKKDKRDRRSRSPNQSPSHASQREHDNRRPRDES